MPLTRSDIPHLLLPGLRADFDLAYRSELDASVADKIATVVSTSLPAQRYGWLGATPPMREFVDERRPAGLSAYSVVIEDRVFESTIAVDRRAIEDDQLDLIRMRVRELAQRVVHHRQQLVVEALVAGFTSPGYDGQPLFSGSHPTVPGSTYSNTTSSALGATSLGEAISQMMLVPDDQGTPLGIVPDTLVVGPALQWTALALVESPVVVYVGSGGEGTAPTPYTNVFAGRLTVVVTPFLQGPTAKHWFLLDTKRPMKGIILQQRADVPVEFTALETGSGSESAFWRDRFYYGVRGRYNVGYGLWQTVFGSNAA